MATIKDEIKSLLDKLPDNCTLEDIQYHLYVAGKIQRGISRGEKESTLSRAEVERKFGEFTSK